MKRRKAPDLIKLADAIPSPVEFFKGVQRRNEPAPDNLIMFVVRRREDLWPPDGGDSFHERWVLLLALDGSGELRLDRRPFRLKPGLAALVPPLHLHGYIKVTPRIRWLFVTFDWPGHAAASETWNGARKLDAGARRRIAALVSHYLPAERDGALAAAQLLELLRHLHPTEETPADSPHSLLAAVQASAKSAPGEKLNRLAERLGVSESHLRARFRNEAGMSLGRYLREARLRQAARWLREEGISVTAAAERARYPDVFSFSRAFRRVLGCSPSSVRLKTS